jgi:gliding motility-associated-like protein
MLTTDAGTSYLWSTGETTGSINVSTAGSYTARITDANGCQSATSSATIVDVSLLPSVDITSSNSSMCANDMRTLTASPEGGTFIITDGPGIISGNILTTTGTGTINLEYNYSDVCANKDTQSIVVYEIPVAVAGPDQDLISVFESQMKAVLNESETGEWSALAGSGVIEDIHDPTTFVTELSTGENKFLWTVMIGGCTASDEVIISVTEIFVPSAITPNGDGKNDFFKINLDPDGTELIVFNRWGIVEYSCNNYANDWDGRNNKGTPLSDDTYFYILKLKNGEIIKGSILIKR